MKMKKKSFETVLNASQHIAPLLIYSCSHLLIDFLVLIHMYVCIWQPKAIANWLRVVRKVRQIIGKRFCISHFPLPFPPILDSLPASIALHLASGILQAIFDI